MAVTYLTAKRNGFTGTFQDWVDAGRPEGKAPTPTEAPKQYDSTGNSYIDPTTKKWVSDTHTILTSENRQEAINDANKMTAEEWGKKWTTPMSDSQYTYKGIRTAPPPQDTTENLTFGEDLGQQISQGGVYDQPFNINGGGQDTSGTDAALEKLATLLADSIGTLVPEKLEDLTPEDLSEISSAVEGKYGDYFTELKSRAEFDFSAARRFAQENLNSMFGETGEDVGEGKKRIARNFQEATMDTQMALANRSLTRGFAREEAEKRLGLTREEQLRDLETGAQRRLEGGQKEYSRQFGGYSATKPSEIMDFYKPPTLNEPGTETTAQERRIEDLQAEKETTIERETSREQEKAFFKLNPQIYPGADLNYS